MANTHEYYMKRALELAQKGMGHTSPNPMVGCVLVKDDRIIGEGFHEKCGELHAERNALKSCTESAKDATMYVTLEPCCHYGKTPPCTEAIIENGIKKVYVGCVDPNEKVGGKGIDILKSYGVDVVTGILEDECYKVNEIFFKYISTKEPFIAMKYAMTLDGKIASFTGDSKWITGEKSREHVHNLRKKYSAIMAGINTVLSDDPMLNCRIDTGVDPIRVICDSNLKIPLDSKIVNTAKDIRTIVVCALKSNHDEIIQQDLNKKNSHTTNINENGFAEKYKKLQEKGIEIIKMESEINLDKLFAVLGSMKIDSVLVEGGGTIHGSILQENLADRVYAYIAPKIIGGSTSKSPVEGRGIELMSNACKLKDIEYLQLDNDMLITGKVVRN